MIEILYGGVSHVKIWLRSLWPRSWPEHVKLRHLKKLASINPSFIVPRAICTTPHSMFPQETTSNFRYKKKFEKHLAINEHLD